MKHPPPSQRKAKLDRAPDSSQFILDTARPIKQVKAIARTHDMKIITHKQRELAMNHVAELLKKDGWSETMTVQQWLDHAEYRPAQFQSSMQALEVLGLLGFGEDQVRASQPT
jgi:hypothetical protein